MKCFRPLYGGKVLCRRAGVEDCNRSGMAIDRVQNEQSVGSVFKRDVERVTEWAEKGAAISGPLDRVLLLSIP